MVRLTYTDNQDIEHIVDVDLEDSIETVDQWFRDNLGYIPKAYEGEMLGN